MARWFSGLDDPHEGLYVIKNMENGEWTLASFDVAWFDGKRWRSTSDGKRLPTPYFYCKAKFWGEIMKCYYELPPS